MAALQNGPKIFPFTETLGNDHVIHCHSEHNPFWPKKWSNMQQKSILLSGTPNHCLSFKG